LLASWSLALFLSGCHAWALSPPPVGTVFVYDVGGERTTVTFVGVRESRWESGSWYEFEPSGASTSGIGGIYLVEVGSGDRPLISGTEGSWHDELREPFMAKGLRTGIYTQESDTLRWEITVLDVGGDRHLRARSWITGGPNEGLPGHDIEVRYHEGDFLPRQIRGISYTSAPGAPDYNSTMCLVDIVYP
jgi:hypothetical protein